MDKDKKEWEVVKEYADKINNSANGEWVTVPNAILAKVLEASDYIGFCIWGSLEKGCWDVKIDV